MPSHPKGSRARVLLSSVFKPFAQDDEYGSRAINPIELYHSQVTREQGPFSLRMFHRSWSLMFLQRNISAPCTVLDFPTRQRFVRELTSHPTTSFSLLFSSANAMRRYRDDPDARVRARVAAEARQLRSGHGAALWAMERFLLQSNPAISVRLRELRLQIEREIGGFSRVIDRVAGPALLWSARREARIPGGRHLEPRTFVDRRNWAR